MSTALLLIHGRDQQMPAAQRRERQRVAAHVRRARQAWLAGLAKGLTLANRRPLADERVFFAFYGNVLADLIAQHERAGGQTPDLEALRVRDAAVGRRDELVLDAAAELGFQADVELSYVDPELAEAVRAPDAEAVWDGALRLSIVRSALQFLSRKTGIPDWVIEQFLDDVAYYLEDEQMRSAVLGAVNDEVTRALDRHDSLVVVGHSLGSVVAYDLLHDGGVGPVRLLTTAGSPLGYPVVQRNLRGVARGTVPAVPPIEPVDGGPHWVNAYDVRDVVALIHPLRERFAGGRATLRDEVTHNPSGPHAIDDYLADPDVAGPIGDALQVGRR